MNQSLKIMIVDDALFMRVMLKRILTEAGYTNILEAVDGEEACNKFQLEMPDIVLLDISMPKMNGIDALKRMKDINRDSIIVMCSAVGQESMILDALTHGAAEFIVKPFKSEHVINVLEQVQITFNS